MRLTSISKVARFKLYILSLEISKREMDSGNKTCLTTMVCEGTGKVEINY